MASLPHGNPPHGQRSRSASAATHQPATATGQARSRSSSRWPRASTAKMSASLTASATQAYQARFTTQDSSGKKKARPKTAPIANEPRRRCRRSATASSAGPTTASGQIPYGGKAAVRARPPTSPVSSAQRSRMPSSPPTLAGPPGSSGPLAPSGSPPVVVTVPVVPVVVTVPVVSAACASGPPSAVSAPAPPGAPSLSCAEPRAGRWACHCLRISPSRLACGHPAAGLRALTIWPDNPDIGRFANSREAFASPTNMVIQRDSVVTACVEGGDSSTPNGIRGGTLIKIRYSELQAEHPAQQWPAADRWLIAARRRRSRPSRRRPRAAARARAWRPAHLHRCGWPPHHHVPHRHRRGVIPGQGA